VEKYSALFGSLKKETRSSLGSKEPHQVSRCAFALGLRETSPSAHCN
jgi:hypothetical protein